MVLEQLTIEDFEKLPDVLAYNHELVDGELVDVSGDTESHIALKDYLLARLLLFVLDHRLGKIRSEQEYDFGGNAHGPDISFFGNVKAALSHRDRRVQLFTPDLAVEIVSKNDTFTSVVRKARRYLEYGTSEVWVFFIPTREVYFYSRDEDRILRNDHVFESPLIPGFQIAIAELFDRT